MTKEEMRKKSLERLKSFSAGGQSESQVEEAVEEHVEIHEETPAVPAQPVVSGGKKRNQKAVRKNDKVQIGLWIDKELDQQLGWASYSTGKTRSEVVEEALKVYLNGK